MKRILMTVAIVTGLLLTTTAKAQSKKTSVTGTVVDTYCLVTMNMTAKPHVKCATTCAKNGAPLAIKEDKTGTVYLAAGQKNMLYASSGLDKYLEGHVTVKGTVYERDGIRMIIVDSVTQN